MIEMFSVLMPILLVDVVNPVLFAFMVYAAGTRNPVTNSSTILIGHTLAYFSAGLVLALGLEQITGRLANPHFIDYVIGLLIGILLLWVAFGSIKKPKTKQTEPEHTLTPIKALGLGAVVNFVGIPFALPYFAALNQILKANLTTTDSVLLLIAYNLLYALPFVMIPILVATMGERSQSILKRASEVVDKVSRYLMPVVLTLAGLALVSDAVRFFFTGRGFF